VRASTSLPEAIRGEGLRSPGRRAASAHQDDLAGQRDGLPADMATRVARPLTWRAAWAARNGKPFSQASMSTRLPGRSRLRPGRGSTPAGSAEATPSMWSAPLL
jgi:hypothetical protein